jgi:hypothetical protein
MFARMTVWREEVQNVPYLSPGKYCAYGSMIAFLVFFSVNAIIFVPFSLQNVVEMVARLSQHFLFAITSELA